MAETLFRQLGDGSFVPADHAGTQAGSQIIVPESPGKAAALARLMAQGGPTDRRGRFTQGRLKGQTYDQVAQKFESMWGSASPEIKDKYAARAGSDGNAGTLAPSEKRVQGIGPTPNPEKVKMYGPAYAATYAETEARRPKTVATPAPKPSAWDSDGNGVPNSIQRPATSTATPPSDFTALTSKPASEYQHVGDTGDRMPDGSIRKVGPAAESSVADLRRTDEVAVKAIPRAAEKSPIARVVSNAVDANTRFWDRTTKAVNTAVTSPFVAPSVTQIGNESNARDAALARQRASENEAMQRKVTEENAAKLRAAAGLPAVAPAAPIADSPAKIQSDAAYGQIADQRKAAGYPETPEQIAARPQTPTGAIIGTPSRINPRTGLPIGYQPGDTVEPKFKISADASVMRQQQAMAAAQTPATPAPPPKAVLAPAPVRYADASANYQTDLDPVKAKAMDAVYSGANSMDQARINAESLKRGSIGLPGAQSAPNRTITSIKPSPMARADSYSSRGNLRIAPKPIIGTPSRPQLARR